MELLSATLFIITVIVGITECAKRAVARDFKGALTIIAAAVVGGVVGAVDIHIGLTNISVAQGIVTGFGAAGVHTIAKQV